MLSVHTLNLSSQAASQQTPCDRINVDLIIPTSNCCGLCLCDYLCECMCVCLWESLGVWLCVYVCNGVCVYLCVSMCLSVCLQQKSLRQCSAGCSPAPDPFLGSDGKVGQSLSRRLDKQPPAGNGNLLVLHSPRLGFRQKVWKVCHLIVFTNSALWAELV